ncbi:NUDIX hydrolase [Nocardioides sp. LHG3406-4]|uniref:NUDIX hydrolase n=1 Tax=Nocardioides sp. LHG3406-4 TaxID=2804575 RepID=UPI003CE80945
MAARPERSKVLCYIVRDARLLVFRHVDEDWDESELQVPAGTVKAGETAQQAALREATEETGLSGLRVVRHLGECRYDMAPYRDEVQHRQVFLLALDGPAPERWLSQEDDPDDASGAHRFECYWLPVSQCHSLSAGHGALLGRLWDEITRP